MSDKKGTPFDLLTERRTVSIIGGIDDSSMEKLVHGLLKLQNESNTPIKLLIGSGGGSMDFALAACDFMTHVMTAPVHGIAWGECSSAATFLLLHCTKRSALPHTMFMIHSGSHHPPKSGIPIDAKIEKNLLDLLQDLQNTRRKVMNMYQKRLGMTEEEVQQLVDRGDQHFNYKMTAEEALRIGLIQEIVEGKVGIF